MKNKIAITIAALLLSVSSFAQTPWNIGTPTAANVTASLSADNKTLTISGTGEMQDFLVDALPWFSALNSIESVVINLGVTSIGDSAFIYCHRLTSIAIPSTATSIGDGAFIGCVALTSITIPEGVRSIGDGAFWECDALTSVTIPESVRSLGDGAFGQCYHLYSVTIPNGITSIGSNTFHNCDALTYVTIPNSVTSIGSGAFQDCDALTSLTIPGNVTSIGGSAFAYAGLTSIIIPNSVTSIGDGAFANTGLTSITIPNSVTSIGSSAFKGTNIDTVKVLANNPPSIGVQAFEPSVRVIVPVGTTDLYKSSPYLWKDLDIIGYFQITLGAAVNGTNGSASSDYGLKGNEIQLTHGTPSAYYESDGWDISSTGTPAASINSTTNKLTIGGSDVTVTAKYKVKDEYTIKLINTGGTNPGTDTVRVTYNVESSPITLPVNPNGAPEFTAWSRGSFQFLGWFNNPGCVGTPVTVVNPGTGASESHANVMYWAKWEATGYNIHYEQNGGTGATDDTYTVESSTIDLPTAAEMTKSGYTFGGWYGNAGLTGAAITNIPAGSTENKTFWAKWEAIVYYIHYEQDGATGATDDTYTVESSTIDLPTAAAMTKPDYTFGGWYGNVGLTGAAITNIPAGSTGDKTFWAKWEATVYNIHYEQDGGTGATDGTYTVESSTIDLPPAAAMTKSGYTFDGWYGDAGLTGSAITDIPSGSTGHKTFWAKWKLVYYIHYHNVIGATMPPDNLEEFYLTTPTFRITNPTKVGYNFVGWFKNAALTDSATFIDKEFFQGTLPLPVPADRIYNFYAKWDGMYHIAYGLNDSPGRPVTNSVNLVLQYDASYLPLTLVNAERTGYEFGGWYADPGTSITKVVAIAYGSASDTALWAKWTPIVYDIFYNQDGGTGATNGHYTIDSLTITLPTVAKMQKTGYTFGGWFDNAALTGTAITTIPAGSTGTKDYWAKWDTITYNITYHLNDNSSRPATNPAGNPATYSIANLPLALDKAVRTGYDMDWYADAGLVTKVVSLANGSTTDTALWAKWTPAVYDIIYNQDGGTGATNGQYTIDSLTIILPTVAKMQKTGYTFGGWFDNAALTGTAITTIPAGSTGTKEFWAKWEAKTYNIAYNLNATTSRPATNPPGNPATYIVADLPLTIAKATRDGYDMDWYADTTKVKTLTKVNSLTQCADTTLWAKWTPLVYDIIYNQNGGTGATNGQYNIDSLTITLPTVAKMTKAGYTFGGWYTDAALTTGPVTTIPAGSTGTKEFWAKWDTITYNITYHVNGDDITKYDTYTIGTPDKDLPTTYTKRGYEFVGWFTNFGLTGTPVSKIFTGTSGDKEYWAKWDTIKYHITYHLDGGTGATYDTYTYETPNKTLPTPTYSGKDFKGWYNNAGLTGSAITTIFQHSTGDTAFWAKWETAKCEVTFRANNNSLEMKSLTKEYDQSILFAKAEQVASDYDFTVPDGKRLVAWTTNENGTGTSYPPGYTYYENASLTVYAQWDIIPYTITFEANNGSGNSTTRQKMHGVRMILPTANDCPFTTPGKEFVGWTEYEYPIGTPTPVTAYSGNADKTFYAIWKTTINTVTYYSYDSENDVMETQSVSKNPGIQLTLISGNTKPFPFTVPTGKHFAGWAVGDPNGEPVYATGSISSLVYTEEADMVLYAVYTAVVIQAEYTITFDANGGSLPAGKAMTPQTKANGVPQSLKKNHFVAPAGSGKQFVGWTTNAANGAVVYEDEGEYAENADETLFAVWAIPSPHTISFNGNGGTLPAGKTMDARIKTEGIDLILPKNKFVAAGKLFTGWSTYRNGEVDYLDGATYTDDASNATLWAQWKDSTYTVTFNANGGGGTMAPQTKTHNEPLRLTNNTFTAPEAEQEFRGWAKNNPSGEAVYAPEGAIYTTNASVVLFAKWGTPVTGVTLDPKELSLIIGGSSPQLTDTLTAILTPANATSDFLWKIGNTNVATIDGGIITATGAGKTTVTVTAKAGNKTATAKVSVIERWTLGNIDAETDGETLTIGGTGAMPDWTEYVTAAPWTKNNSTITTVVVENGVTTIGSNAFNDLYNCSSITLPETLTRIGSQAFKNCSSLSSITINGNVTDIGAGAFVGCSGLTSVVNYRTQPQPILGKYIFDSDTYRKASLIVLEGTETLYANVYDWCRFSNVQEGVCQIDFNVQGGSVVPQQWIATGTKLAAFTAPTRTGYRFDGWYQDAACTKAKVWSLTNNVTSNLTLYAKWVKVLTVTFHSQGGSYVEAQEVEPNSTIDFPANPVREGYVFDGWYQDADCTDKWYSTDYVGKNDIHLYAKWRSASTAIEVIDDTSPSLHVYPNPTTGELNIENAKDAEISLYNMNGILQLRTNESRINIEAYPSGIYFLRAGVEIVKVVKK